MIILGDCPATFDVSIPRMCRRHLVPGGRWFKEFLPRRKDPKKWWNTKTFNGIDWFEGTITGTSHFSWENLWFPVKIFPFLSTHWSMEFPHVLRQQQQSGGRHHEACLHSQSTSTYSSFFYWVNHQSFWLCDTEPKIDKVMSQEQLLILVGIQPMFSEISKLRIWNRFSSGKLEKPFHPMDFEPCLAHTAPNS